MNNSNYLTMNTPTLTIVSGSGSTTMNEHEYCEWCKQSLEELMSPNINELCIDCTGEAE
jgi:GMP synthase-like glutamine amidotransferase